MRKLRLKNEFGCGGCNALLKRQNVFEHWRSDSAGKALFDPGY
ncbi:hypothetical protein VHA_001558 [Grimontia hollisae CIP 101886]|uniref:Uncharacterized protein n=1 Tax=Grimontia hollisae CIP 101886 TaxID=675812 RepID=D0I739_GRIHO|nr:hypothetical protein VHA_001558 [Grimontia hollisae CIP 101886]